MPFPFANGVLLWGLVAAAIPLIIHLLNRRRVRVVLWGAMKFLRDAVIVRRRRIRLEELLLLLLRTLILVVLVLAMARPFLVGGLFGAGRQHRDLVIVLDTSLSMGSSDGVRTSFSKALDLVRQNVDSLQEGDAVNVVLASKVPRALFPELTFDLRAVRTSLDSLKPFRSSLDMPRSLRLAGNILASGTSPLKQIVVITDGQSFGWSPDDRAAWSALADELAPGGVKPEIYVASVGPGAAPENLAISSIQLSRAAVGTDREVGLQVEIANHSDVDISGRKLKLSIDDVPKSEVDVSVVRPHSTVTLPFTHQFDRTGPSLVTAQLDDDALPADNVSYLGLEVLKELPVLLVDGDPGKSPSESELIYLRAALDPIDPASMKRINLITASIDSIDRIDRAELLRYAAVVLANVKSIPPAQVTLLEQFVRSGGGLLVAPGDNADKDFYNQSLFADGRGVLPAPLGDRIGDARSRKAFVSLLTTALNHQALSVFRDPDKADLSRAKFYEHWRVDRTAPGALPIALFNDGSPFLVERSLGAGRVILMTTPVDAAWSNLPLRPNYVTLMHELVYYLASPVLPSRNLLVGENLVLELPKPDRLVEVKVTGPSGASRQATVEQREGRWFAVYPHTDEGGLYKVEVTGPAGPRAVTFAVNVDPAESDLKPLSDSDRGLIADRTGMKFMNSPADLINEVFAGSIHKELWRILMVLVILMLLFEIAFTRKLSLRQSEGINVAADDGISRLLAGVRKHAKKETEEEKNPASVAK